MKQLTFLQEIQDFLPGGEKTCPISPPPQINYRPHRQRAPDPARQVGKRSLLSSPCRHPALPLRQHTPVAFESPDFHCDRNQAPRFPHVFSFPVRFPFIPSPDEGPAQPHSRASPQGALQRAHRPPAIFCPPPRSPLERMPSAARLQPRAPLMDVSPCQSAASRGSRSSLRQWGGGTAPAAQPLWAVAAGEARGHAPSSSSRLSIE